MMIEILNPQLLFDDRVPCKKTGGINFTLTGNPNFVMVLVSNVGGAGDVEEVYVKRSEDTDWQQLSRNWGTVWTYQDGDGEIQQKSLSFKVVTSDHNEVISENVVPANWNFNQSFAGSDNFQCLNVQKL